MHRLLSTYTHHCIGQFNFALLHVTLILVTECPLVPGEWEWVAARDVSRIPCCPSRPPLHPPSIPVSYLRKVYRLWWKESEFLGTVLFCLVMILQRTWTICMIVWECFYLVEGVWILKIYLFIFSLSYFHKEHAPSAKKRISIWELF